MERITKASGSWCSKSLLFNSLTIGIVLLGLSACFEPKEGCLDVRATNYDVAADKDCSDCCEYPELVLEVVHAAGDTSLRYSDPYTLDGLHFFKLARVRFYLSDVQLKRPGQSVGVSDTLQLVLGMEPNRFEQTITDNFALIQRNQFTYSLGDFRETGFFDSIAFKVGIDLPVNTADPADLPSGHPLAPLTDSMHWSLDSGYIYNQVLLQKDTFPMTDTTYLSVGLIDNLVEVSLPIGQTIRLGFDVTIPLRIDYLKWLEGIDFVADSDEEMIRKIVNNTPNAFSIVE